MTAKWTPDDLKNVVDSYCAGASPEEIGRKLGISPNPILRVLREAGIKLRSRSDAERTKWARWKIQPDYEAVVERQCGAAWRAARIHVHGNAEVTARARSLHANGNRRGRPDAHEDELAAALSILGLETIPQFPIYRYNIDLAFPEDRVAVEVVSHPVNPQYVATLRKRTEHLIDTDWFVLYVEVIRHAPDRRPIRFDLVAKKILSLLERARENEPLRGKYGVIGRQGDPSAALRKYLDHLPRVERP